MTFRVFVGVIAVLLLSPTSVALAVGETALVVTDLPGYVHVSSAIDGEINGATLLEELVKGADATSVDQARSHAGQGRSWRSTDGTTVAIAWVLDYGSETAATNLATDMTLTAMRGGTMFEPGLSGTAGVSIDSNGKQIYTVFWSQGTHFAATTVFAPDATRAVTDVTLLARLEADTLQHAIGGERNVLGLPASTKSTAPTTPGRTDLTRWVIAVAVAMILAMAVLTVYFRRSNRRRPPPLADPVESLAHTGVPRNTPHEQFGVGVGHSTLEAQHR
ncbi:MAG: hypothetical protein ACXVH5_03645 [Ilumatobacteraceae bacterium]